ncbi:hypothetical protein, partial [Rosenbergiella nectarea]|uniref:hypothetical protein n=1 Tax=Rosenbergiella nectarea TaxID=988801 RepID=UPI001F4E67E8
MPNFKEVENIKNEIKDNIFYFENTLSKELLDDLILKHYQVLTGVYSENKFFYKSIFKHSRFILVSMIVAEYYVNEKPRLIDISKRYSSLKLMSKNSVSTFYSFLVVTGRLKIWKSTLDARRLKFSITNKAKKEAYDLIITMNTSFQSSLKENPDINVDDFLSSFFKRFHIIINENMLNFEEIEHADIFIHKDAGHMIILSLFCNKQNLTNEVYESMPLKDLMGNCGVSRSHLKKILQHAEAVGFVENASKESNIYITERFLDFTRSY